MEKKVWRQNVVHKNMPMKSFTLIGKRITVLALSFLLPRQNRKAISYMIHRAHNLKPRANIVSCMKSRKKYIPGS